MVSRRTVYRYDLQIPVVSKVDVRSERAGQKHMCPGTHRLKLERYQASIRELEYDLLNNTTWLSVWSRRRTITYNKWHVEVFPGFL